MLLNTSLPNYAFIHSLYTGMKSCDNPFGTTSLQATVPTLYINDWLVEEEKLILAWSVVTGGSNSINCQSVCLSA